MLDSKCCWQPTSCLSTPEPACSDGSTKPQLACYFPYATFPMLQLPMHNFTCYTLGSLCLLVTSRLRAIIENALMATIFSALIVTAECHHRLHSYCLASMTMLQIYFGHFGKPEWTSDQSHQGLLPLQYVVITISIAQPRNTLLVDWEAFVATNITSSGRCPILKSLLIAQCMQGHSDRRAWHSLGWFRFRQRQAYHTQTLSGGQSPTGLYSGSCTDFQAVLHLKISLAAALQLRRVVA